MNKLGEATISLFATTENEHGDYYLVVGNSNIEDYGMHFDEFDDLIQKVIINKLKQEFGIWT